MARLSLLSLSAAAMAEEDFTEEEVFTVVEVFTEEAGSEAEDFMAEAGFAAEDFTVAVDSMGEVDSAVELSVEAARFEVGPGFVEDPSAADSGEVFVAMVSASGAVSVSEDAALGGEDGAGVGA